MILLRSFVCGLFFALPIVSSDASAARTKQACNQYTNGLCKWTAANSINLTYYNVVPEIWDNNPYWPPVVASPDGRYFFTLRFRGDAATGDTIQTLEVYDTTQVERVLSGKLNSRQFTSLTSVEFRTRTEQTPIQEARWSENSDAIEFIGVSGADKGQIYKLMVSSRELRQMTSDPFSKYSAFAFDKVSVYRRTEKRAIPPINPRPAEPAPRDKGGEIKLSWPPPAIRYEWVAVVGKEDPWILPIAQYAENEFGVPTIQLTVSADNNFGIIMIQDFAERPQKFLIADFRRRVIKELADVSSEARNINHFDTVNKDLPNSARMFWTSDGRHAILIQTATISNNRDSNGSRNAGYVATYDVANDRLAVLQPFADFNGQAKQPTALRWDGEANALTIHYGQSGEPSLGLKYRFVNDRWVKSLEDSPVSRATERGFRNGLKVFVEQEANTPPRLMASKLGSRAALTGDDDALKGVWWAKQQLFKWRLSDGQMMEGGLSLPYGYKPGKRIPLVIQAVGDYRPDLFLPDGTVPSGFAKQQLVAGGIAVLEIASFGMPSENTPKERQDFLDRAESAVLELSLLNIIDQSKVGLIGHSRTGQHVQYAISHAKRVRFAAAEVWDAFLATYSGYLKVPVLELGFRESDFTRYNGLPSFWLNKSGWLQEEITFNADRIATPTLLTETGGAGNATYDVVTISNEAVQVLGAYKMNRRPADYVSFRAGHTFARVSDRLAALSLTDDWMQFWLKGVEDASQSKVEQYQRWRSMRTKWLVQQEWEAMGHKVGSKPVAVVINDLGYKSLYQRADFDSAIRYFEANSLLNPDSGSVLDSLAEAYLQSGQTKRAIESYKKAVILDSEVDPLGRKLKLLDSGSMGVAQLKAELRKSYFDEQLK